jgi:phenylacetic acid degradation operon negative regulatory protein
MGIKERRTKILIAIFLLSDLSFQAVIFDENVQKIFDLAFNQKTKGTISTLLKEGLIEGGEGEKSYRLTEKGFLELALHFPYVRFLKDKWDGKWRILSYEIPEKKRELRDKLRRQVAGWGLGPWHRSFWLTPHPIISDLRELVFGKEEETYIQAFEADHIFGDREILIEKVWGRSELERKYRELFKKWHIILSQNDDKIAKLSKVSAEYISLLRQDPGLPVELVGSNWIGHEAFSIYKEIRGILLS